jgi:hypothetical protein
VIEPRCAEVANHAAGRLNALLGGGLVGVYLHGSAVLGDWQEARSDVDLLAVSTGRVSAPERQAVGRELVSMTWPGVGLEFSLMIRSVAEHPSDPPPFELHVATTDGITIVDGSGRAGDADLLVHVLMTRRAGASILGPSPEIVFGEPPRGPALLALEEDLRWALERGKLGYAVLNACRSVRFLKEDLVSSKVDAGWWAIEHRVAPSSIVREAIAQRQGARSNIDENEAATFVDHTRALLRRAATTAS